jgi:hypothetical protein
MAAGNRNVADKPRALARLGWFVVYWAAGVLSLTVVGLAIRLALKV